MPIPFSSISAHIRNGIVQKLNYFDFVRFSRVSQKSFAAAKNVKTKYAFEFEFGNRDIILLAYRNEELKIGSYCVPTKCVSSRIFEVLPIRLNDRVVAVFDRFSEEFCSAFSTFLSQTSSSFNKIILGSTSCSADSLNRLIEIGRGKKIVFRERLSSTYTHIEDFKTAAKLVFNYLDEAEIFTLRSSNFTIKRSNLTSEGARLIIEELIAGKRHIDKCKIHTNRKLDTDLIAGIPNLDLIARIPSVERRFINSEEFSYIGNDCSFCVTITRYCYSSEETIKIVKR